MLFNKSASLILQQDLVKSKKIYFIDKCNILSFCIQLAKYSIFNFLFTANNISSEGCLSLGNGLGKLTLLTEINLRLEIILLEEFTNKFFIIFCKISIIFQKKYIL